MHTILVNTSNISKLQSNWVLCKTENLTNSCSHWSWFIYFEGIWTQTAKVGAYFVTIVMYQDGELRKWNFQNCLVAQLVLSCPDHAELPGHLRWLHTRLWPMHECPLVQQAWFQLVLPGRMTSWWAAWGKQLKQDRGSLFTWTICSISFKFQCKNIFYSIWNYTNPECSSKVLNSTFSLTGSDEGSSEPHEIEELVNRRAYATLHQAARHTQLPEMSWFTFQN